ncbi:MAG: caspase family protein [Elusimicrobiota bacterium]
MGKIRPLLCLAAAAVSALLSGCATPPLVAAAQKGDDAQVQAFLNGGADVNDGRPLFAAAAHGRASTVKLLLDRGAEAEFSLLGQAFNALCTAVMSDSVETVKVLLDRGLPANEPNCMAPYHWTPLQLAMGYEKNAVAAYLRAHGGTGGDSRVGVVAAAPSPRRGGVGLFGPSGGAKTGGSSLGSMFGGAAPKAEPEADETPQPRVQPPSPRPEASVTSDVDEPSYGGHAARADDFALLIGISKYRDIPEAQFADNDAKAMKRHLLAMGYPEENIISLLGDHATNSSIAEKLERWLPMNVNADSTVFVYYSGHGAPDAESKQAYLVPWDGQPGALAETAFPLARFYKDLQKLPARHVLVALDSCFSGAGGRSVLAKGARPLVAKIDTEVPQDGKLVVFTASRADQVSGTLEDQGHGAFTYYFLKGLNGEAVADGSAAHVTVGSLYGYLAKRVNAAAHRQEREQNPQLLPSVESNGSLQIR